MDFLQMHDLLKKSHDKLKLENEGLKERIKELEKQLEEADARQFAIWRQNNCCTAAYMLGVRNQHIEGETL